jgi:hypothetical protein
MARDTLGYVSQLVSCIPLLSISGRKKGSEVILVADAVIATPVSEKTDN